ncbi:hypothetical protein QBC35DRAFT_387524 [Podospora australis]|uniref:Uncharacterized protein n=1 Tax=Podospora australis TaxID=1536484 RepID=A0AAN6WU27_9PEZI|nr:hypothetical protein QBC35DRAFT_387524 [Podospora australis]
MSFLLVVIFLLAVVITAVAGKGLRARRWRTSPPDGFPADEKSHLSKQQTAADQAFALKAGIINGLSSGNPSIQPLLNFDWKTTEPLKLRPFKPKYHITMAIQNSAPSDLIVIDRNYFKAVAYRQVIMKNHPKTVMGCIPSGVAPLQELYSYLLGEYLPTRYPSMFSLSPDRVSFTNKVTGSSYPISPVPSNPEDIMRILGSTIEDDIFLLIQDPETKEHRSVAFICCHPSGFDPAEKLDKVLAAIHGPVPAYEKIGASMERFFAKLEAWRGVKRMNWSLQTHTNLFAPSGNHVHADEEVEEETSVDITSTRFRVELQSLTRLPKTNAICFSFKTFLYPLEEIKDEGLGLDLADAIEGLKAGNAPGMWVYKGSIRWGRAICEYLRS